MLQRVKYALLNSEGTQLTHKMPRYLVSDADFYEGSMILNEKLKTFMHTHFRDGTQPIRTQTQQSFMCTNMQS